MKKLIISLIIGLFVGFGIGYLVKQCPMNSDLNRDGKVDLIDASIFFHDYNK